MYIFEMDHVFLENRPHLLLQAVIEAHGHATIGAYCTGPGYENSGKSILLQDTLCPDGMMGTEEGNDPFQGMQINLFPF